MLAGFEYNSIESIRYILYLILNNTVLTVHAYGNDRKWIRWKTNNMHSYKQTNV